MSNRELHWSHLATKTWDLLVIGGGITGASIQREATRAGLRVLLVEQRDFAWGTSSRSTKLVHGGLRYLATGDVRLVRESIRERERLLAEGDGLVTPLPFLLASHRREGLKRWQGRIGVAAYALLEGTLPDGNHRANTLRALVPALVDEPDLVGVPYAEATVDDARLVLRLIQESTVAGATALNYARVTGLLREDGQVVGATLKDTAGAHEATVRARAVVNATGAWADALRAHPPRLRPLRGSHLVFSAERFPLTHGVSFRFARDGRFVCALPWEGATVLGTTDLDHPTPLDTEPSISAAEVEYLLAAAQAEFPSLGLTRADVRSCYAGVRPVISSGERDPSKESRDHLVLAEDGLLTVTGGKLTTCRAIAQDALQALRSRLPALASLQKKGPFLDAAPALAADLPAPARARLQGRYGAAASRLVSETRAEELQPIPGTPTLWAELRWAARHERVVHLEDLLLRRVRLGLLLPHGGEAELPAIRALCQQELSWDDSRWEREAEAYLALWRTHHALPAEA
ncbi:glycerol-3-phosphate dehydrogenase/oxidase [Aggregicoccus sp. 17bor-14]|uniref:glycerol-3-phosphate dehydrogenase/oxidase n=1 Tax=Myxococcaceae TaxID=31 RepID=UPI00129C8F1C|nr:MULTISPECIES: glycerol-3-phosphate dehydrogenase/oxidase [Myxococcaceae]MBF5044771.1 glycerol-3-phosphate dehydrogenase/oxidase [Simulacricoccus sp. 17bor-14]MRI90515.1 glycerol-3-phosphate dehydrogenase/oxidase [Aggregicoccus sp. 17bor-14]